MCCIIKILRKCCSKNFGARMNKRFTFFSIFFFFCYQSIFSIPAIMFMMYARWRNKKINKSFNNSQKKERKESHQSIEMISHLYAIWKNLDVESFTGVYASSFSLLIHSLQHGFAAKKRNSKEEMMMIMSAVSEWLMRMLTREEMSERVVK